MADVFPTEFKFACGANVVFLHENQLTKGRIIARKRVDISDLNYSERKIAQDHFGIANISYYITTEGSNFFHLEVHEAKLFSTKEDLLKSL